MKRIKACGCFLNVVMLYQLHVTTPALGDEIKNSKIILEGRVDMSSSYKVTNGVNTTSCWTAPHVCGVDSPLNRFLDNIQ